MASPTAQDTSQDLDALLNELGAVSPSRIRIKIPLGLAREEDLIELNNRRDSIYELVDGLMVEKGMGFNESILALVLAGYLRAFVVSRNLGLVTGADGMMRLAPGLIRIPDLAYTSWDRIPGRRRPSGPIAGFAPDLAIEILGRSNTRSEMNRKRREYFEAGVVMVWEIDPEARSVAVYLDPTTPNLLHEFETMNEDPVLPGFVLPLADLFSELDRQGV